MLYWKHFFEGRIPSLFKDDWKWPLKNLSLGFSLRLLPLSITSSLPFSISNSPSLSLSLTHTHTHTHTHSLSLSLSNTLPLLFFLSQINMLTLFSKTYYLSLTNTHNNTVFLLLSLPLSGYFFLSLSHSHIHTHFSFSRALLGDGTTHTHTHFLTLFNWTRPLSPSPSLSYSLSPSSSCSLSLSHSPLPCVHLTYRQHVWMSPHLPLILTQKTLPDPQVTTVTRLLVKTTWPTDIWPTHCLDDRVMMLPLGRQTSDRLNAWPKQLRLWLTTDDAWWLG